MALCLPRMLWLTPYRISQEALPNAAVSLPRGNGLAGLQEQAWAQGAEL